MLVTVPRKSTWNSLPNIFQPSVVILKRKSAWVASARKNNHEKHRSQKYWMIKLYKSCYMTKSIWVIKYANCSILKYSIFWKKNYGIAA